MKHFIKRAAAWFCTLLIATLPLSAAAAPIGGGQASPFSTIKAYGCDMSFWNVGGDYPDYSRVDFQKMKADGCDFVILRVGFEGTQSRQNTLDSAFLTLYKQAKAAELGVGVYFYALATTYEGAAEDAAWCIDLFEENGLSFEYPIYYDVEDPGNGADRPGHEALSAAETTQLCLGWAQTLEAAGYYPGVYAGYDILTKLQPAYTYLYDVWYAYVAYVEGIPEFIPEEQDHSAFCDMWQYSWKGTFDGAVGDLDVNVAYKDYPTIMKTNGYNNIAPAWHSSPSVMPHPNNTTLYDYNGNGEGIAPTYRAGGDVTLTNTVTTTSWSWPSAYAACYTKIDVTRHPLFKIRKSGTAHFNAVLHYTTANGSMQSFNLASLDGQELGEFNSGEMTVTVDIASALKRAGHMPPDGKLSVTGVTYYIMGTTDSYVTLHAAEFTESPFPHALTSPHYKIDDRFVANVTAALTVSELFEKFDNIKGVVVRRADGALLEMHEKVASGMSIVIEHEGTVIKAYTLSVLGDVNSDGAITTMDARTVLGSITNATAMSDWQTLSADFDQSQTITTADVRDLLFAVLA